MTCPFILKNILVRLEITQMNKLKPDYLFLIIIPIIEIYPFNKSDFLNFVKK